MRVKPISPSGRTVGAKRFAPTGRTGRAGLYVLVVKYVGELKFDRRRVLHDNLTLALRKNCGVIKARDHYVLKINLLELVSMHKGLVLKSLAR